MRGTCRARELRKSQTDAEAKLWRHLRDRRLGGFKFRRQYPFGPYIVDFVCLEARLIIEVDGGQHLDKAPYDTARTHDLARFGMAVLRYWNDDVLLHIDAVLAHILAGLVTPHRAPHPNPLPASGERE